MAYRGKHLDLAVKGIPFLGEGVLGNEESVRHGLSIMSGEPKEAYKVKQYC